MHFVKVKPFNYHGRRFTIKPTEHVKNLHLYPLLNAQRKKLLHLQH
jgi:hypothetical protein